MEAFTFNKNYALESGGPERLQVSWNRFYRGMSVALDGSPVLAFSDKKQLRAGGSTQLPDGSTLQVKLEQQFAGERLAITRNGVALPGSGSDPQQLVNGAKGVLYFVAVASIVVGGAAQIFQIQELLKAGYGVASIVFGAIFGVLGYYTGRKSAFALGLAIILFSLDAIASLAMGSHSATGLGMHIILLIPMIRGFGAVRKIARSAAPA